MWKLKPSCNPVSSLVSLFAKWERSKRENYFSKKIISGQCCHVTIIVAVTQIKKKGQKKKRLKKDFKLRHWNLFTMCTGSISGLLFLIVLSSSVSLEVNRCHFLSFFWLSQNQPWATDEDSAWLIESLLMRLSQIPTKSINRIWTGKSSNSELQLWHSYQLVLQSIWFNPFCKLLRLFWTTSVSKNNFKMTLVDDQNGIA